jgi:hypothetical protein
MAETISGIIAAVVIIILSQVLSRYFTVRLFAATVLVAIAFIYVGFSLKGNPVHLIISEVSFALVLYFLAIIGYTRNSLLVAYGIILHGLWDIFHHNGFLIGTDIPDYWPSFCFIIDIIDGLYFLILFKKEKVSNLIK